MLLKNRILFIDTTHPYLYEGVKNLGFEYDQFDYTKKSDYENIIGEYFGVIIRSKFQLDKNFLDKAKNLKFIARVGSGMENVDVAYAESLGIKCINSPEGNRDAVGEQAIGMLLCLFNNLIRADKEVSAGVWHREQNRGIEIMGKTIGIIGYGNTGSAFAQKLKGFDTKVLAYDKYKSNFSCDNVIESDMETIFKESDVLSFHVPLTLETTYLFNDNYLNNFAKGIYLINTSRGKVVDTQALVKGLKSAKVLGAALDVLEYENISFEDMQRTEAEENFQWLTKSEKVILSPHIAGWTHESNIKLSSVIVEKIKSEFT